MKTSLSLLFHFQALPRTVWLDVEEKHRLLQWPIEEIESLRKKKATLKDFKLEKGSTVKVQGVKGTQV